MDRVLMLTAPRARSWLKSNTKRARVLANYYSFAFLLVRLFPVLLVPLVVIFNFDEIDRAICPSILECADPCVVEADPD